MTLGGWLNYSFRFSQMAQQVIYLLPLDYYSQSRKGVSIDQGGVGCSNATSSGRWVLSVGTKTGIDLNLGFQRNMKEKWLPSMVEIEAWVWIGISLWKIIFNWFIYKNMNYHYSNILISLSYKFLKSNNLEQKHTNYLNEYFLLEFD